MLLNPLRAYRTERGLSLSDLAECAGMNRAALAAVESGEKFLSREQAIDIAQTLRISIDELASYTRHDPGSDS